MNRPQKRQPDDVPRAGEKLIDAVRDWYAFHWSDEHRAEVVNKLDLAYSNYSQALAALPTNAEAQPDLVGPEITDEREPKSTSASFPYWEKEALVAAYIQLQKDCKEIALFAFSVGLSDGSFAEVRPRLNAILGPQVEGHGETSQAQQPTKTQQALRPLHNLLNENYPAPPSTTSGPSPEAQAHVSAEAVEWLMKWQRSGPAPDFLIAGEILTTLRTLGATPAQTKP